MGTSVILKPLDAASITISEANSIPPVLRLSLSRDSLVMALMPQWASDILVSKRQFKIPVSAGLPTYLCRVGMAPGSILPLSLVPMTMSHFPSRRSSKNPFISCGS